MKSKRRLIKSPTTLWTAPPCSMWSPALAMSRKSISLLLRPSLPKRGSRPGLERFDGPFTRSWDPGREMWQEFFVATRNWSTSFFKPSLPSWSQEKSRFGRKSLTRLVLMFRLFSGRGRKSNLNVWRKRKKTNPPRNVIAVPSCQTTWWSSTGLLVKISAFLNLVKPTKLKTRPTSVSLSSMRPLPRRLMVMKLLPSQAPTADKVIEKNVATVGWYLPTYQLVCHTCMCDSCL